MGLLLCSSQLCTAHQRFSASQNLVGSIRLGLPMMVNGRHLAPIGAAGCQRGCIRMHGAPYEGLQSDGAVDSAVLEKDVLV